MLNNNPNIKKAIFIIAGLSCLTPFVDPPIALLLGIVLSQIIGHPFLNHNSKATKYLLQFSVVGLGFGMNLFEAAKAGQQGLLFTVASISITLFLGLLVGKLLAINKKTSLLISTGTAICGGSAIAAIAPIIEAEEDEMSVSLGTIFILNAIALFLFPVIGHYFNLSQHQFGLWSAIAIHDTSSVVGAAHKFGADALQIATTVKLERALWIIPISFIIAIAFKNKKTKVGIPYFILLFIVAMSINTLFPQLHSFGQAIVIIAKKGLTLTLFFIGAGLTKTALKNVGIKPFILGIALWVFISVSSLLVILETVN